MSYAIVLAPKFQDDFHRLPASLQELVLDEIDRLASHPVGLSQSPGVDAARYQVYHFFGFAAGTTSRFEIHFQYGQDEQSLHLLLLIKHEPSA
jgi:hypothetical protein